MEDLKTHFITTIRPFTEGAVEVFEQEIPVRHVRQAFLTITALGIYEAELNGRKVGDLLFTPGYTYYPKNLHYQRWDVTELLSDDTVLRVYLSQGWYCGRFTYENKTQIYGEQPAVSWVLETEMEDGSTCSFCSSDGTVRAVRSPYEYAGFYDGERFCGDRGSAEIFQPVPYTGRLPDVFEESTFGVKIQEEMPVQSATKSGDVTILDFGQNFAGIVEIDLEKMNGSSLKLRHGELLTAGGTLYTANLRKAKAEIVCQKGGASGKYRPRFTYMGFRYVELSGVDYVPGLITAYAIHSEMARTGEFSCGNQMAERLYRNQLWGQKSNYIEVPTDCPQRDERLGWTGDAAIISAAACKNIYMPAFFHHFIENVGLEEEYHGGAVPFYVPAPKKAKPGTTGIDVDPGDFMSIPEGDTAAFDAAVDKYPELRAAVNALPEEERNDFVVKVITENFSFEHGNRKGAAIWSDVATMMPWAVYENYGDLNLLRAEYPVMKTWVERMRQDDIADGGRGLWLRGRQLGDWLALDKPDPNDAENPFGATDLQYTASCFYFYSTELTMKAARALGYTEDAEDYAALSEKIRGAVISEYFNEDGSFKIEGTQTACVLSLFFGIYPEGKKDAVLDQLKSRLEARNWHLDTGFCGTPFLCRVLSDNGANDIAYTLFLNDDFPSWLYEVKLGATTVWERWNSLLPDGSISGTGMNSLNHYAYGSIADWMYRNMAGLCPSEEEPGYKRATICPMPDPRIRSVKMEMDTASGLYKVGWRYDGDRLRYQIEVPFDCTADIMLPCGRVEKVSAGSYAFDDTFKGFGTPIGYIKRKGIN